MTLPKKIIIAALLAALVAAFIIGRLTEHKPVQSISATTSTVPPTASVSAMAADAPTKKIDSVEVMAERLRARLDKEPNDINGWVLLGRSYHYLERWDEAKAAFAKARALGYQGEDEPASASTAVTASASDSSNAVFADIGRVAQNGNIDGDDGATIGDSARVRVAVNIAPELRAKFAPATVVFIFARAPQGSRMPLAAVRKTLGELPAEIDLDDSLAMMPEAKISTAATVVVGARIAPSGNPITQPDDVEVLSAPLSNWRGRRVSLLLSGH